MGSALASFSKRRKSTNIALCRPHYVCHGGCGRLDGEEWGMKNHTHIYIYIYVCVCVCVCVCSKTFSGPRMTGDRLWYCEM